MPKATRVDTTPRTRTSEFLIAVDQIDLFHLARDTSAVAIISSLPDTELSPRPVVCLSGSVTLAFTALHLLRNEARDEIDRLLTFLDATEADADLEPSLGWPEVDPGRLVPGDAGHVDDREADDDFEDEGRVLS